MLQQESCESTKMKEKPNFNQKEGANYYPFAIAIALGILK